MTMSTQAGAIGIVGGTGLYDLDGLTDQQWITVRSPFGQPSDQLLVGRLGDVKVVFLPRHGRGHRIPPHEIDFRANIDALKRAGCGQVISVSAVGSLRAELPPGTMVVVDQFIDRTLRGPRTFFGTGLVAHVAFGHPVCARLSAALVATGQGLGLPVVDGGTYVAMEGPQFSTRAESELHRGLGASVIGMTNLPEAKLAREAEIALATLAMVTDYDCWKTDEAAVTAESVLAHVQANASMAKQILARVLPQVPAVPDWPEHRALDTALVTDRKLWPEKTAQSLKPLLERFL